MCVYDACLLFRSLVVTVWGSVGMFFCVAGIVMDSVLVLSVEVCCVLCKWCDGFVFSV